MSAEVASRALSPQLTVNQSRLGVINGARGLAILAIFFHHLAGQKPDAGWSRFGPFSVPLAAPLANAWQGVGLFFVLSGFVLFLPYAKGSRSIQTRADVVEFYRRRWFRLFPLYYLNVLVAMIFFERLTATRTALRELVCMATGLFPLCRMFYPRFNWVLWSLSVEIAFSVIFPALVVFARRYGIWRLLVLSLVVSWLTQYAGMRLHAEGVIKDGVFGRLADFAVGMLLAELHVRDRVPRRGALCAAVGFTTLYLAFVAWSLCATSVWPRDGMAFTGTLSNLAFFLILCGGFEFAPLRAVLSNGFLQVVGMMCYSLYLWHGIAGVALFKDAHPSNLAELGLYLFLVAGISTLTYRYVEFPRVSDWRKLFRPA